VLVGAVVLWSKPRPDGEAGPAADALARSIEAAVGKDAWERTGAVTWSFRGRRRHLWDRQRMLDRVEWGDNQVLVNLTTQRGLAFKKGVAQSGEAGEKLLKKAYAFYINDSFWLNPLVKLFDDGTVRKQVAQPSGRPALLIQYMSGGLTPGDSYLWLLGDDGRPIENRMWVSILPLKGLGISCEGWVTLSTGAQISTLHKGPLSLAVRLTDVKGAASLAELWPGPDPFAAIVAMPR
jgi:hypothetical protein